jgi:hypothetical protein
VSNSYRATLQGNTLEWHTRAPEVQKVVEVEVVIVEPQHAKTEQGKHMAQALQALADTRAFENVEPLAWQKEQR